MKQEDLLNRDIQGPRTLEPIQDPFADTEKNTPSKVDKPIEYTQEELEDITEDEKSERTQMAREKFISWIKAELDAIQELLEKGAKGTESIKQGGLDKLNQVLTLLKQTKEYLSVLDLSEDSK